MAKKRWQYVIVPVKESAALLAKPDVMKTFPWAIVITNHIGFPVAFDLGELGYVKSLVCAAKLGAMIRKSFIIPDGSLELKRREITESV